MSSSEQSLPERFQVRGPELYDRPDIIGKQIRGGTCRRDAIRISDRSALVTIELRFNSKHGVEEKPDFAASAI